MVKKFIKPLNTLTENDNKNLAAELVIANEERYVILDPPARVLSHQLQSPPKHQ